MIVPTLNLPPRWLAGNIRTVTHADMPAFLAAAGSIPICYGIAASTPPVVDSLHIFSSMRTR